MNSSISISEFFRGLLGALAAVAALVVVLEIVLRVLPIVSGVHRQSPHSGAASARLVANHDYRWSMGWDLRHVVHGKTNAMGFISPYDFEIGRKVARVMCGGELEPGSLVDEDWFLKLEREEIMNLLRSEKTQARIAHTLATGKPLRN